MISATVLDFSSAVENSNYQLYLPAFPRLPPRPFADNLIKSARLETAVRRAYISFSIRNALPAYDVTVNHILPMGLYADAGLFGLVSL